MTTWFPRCGGSSSRNVHRQVARQQRVSSSSSFGGDDNGKLTTTTTAAAALLASPEEFDSSIKTPRELLPTESNSSSAKATATQSSHHEECCVENSGKTACEDIILGRQEPDSTSPSEVQLAPPPVVVAEQPPLDQEDGVDRLTLTKLPDDILLKIFSLFTPLELSRTLALVSRQFYNIAYRQSLWKELDLCVNETNAHVVRKLLEKIGAGVRWVNFGLEAGTCADSVSSALTTSIPSLTVLDLGFLKGYSLPILDILIDRCPNVRSLNLEGVTELTDSTMDVLASVTAWPHLEEVCLSHCINVTGDGLETLFKSQKRIKCLNVDGINHIQDRSIEVLAKTQKATLLRLFLDGEELSDSGVCPLMMCENLQQLSISFCENLTDSVLCYIKELKRLNHLHLRKGTDFSEDGFRALFSPLDGLKNLEFLNLSECSVINDRCIDQLTKCCPDLRSLCLSWCWSVTERGLVMITERLKVCQLLCLEAIKSIFGGCFLGDFSHDTAHHLRYLNLHCCNSGQAFRDAPELYLSNIAFIDLRQCNVIDDGVIMALVGRKRDLTVVNYYGDLIDYDSVHRASGQRNNCLNREKVEEILARLPGGCCMTAV